VVIISHLIVNLKSKFMEIFKTVFVHILVGFILTQLISNVLIAVGPVGIGGG
jgi:hypothetical protein